MYIYWWKCKECDYDFREERKLKNHVWRNHGYRQISTGFKFFKCFSGSTGFIGSTSGLFEGLFEEVTSSEVADTDVTVWEGTDCEETVRKRLFAGLFAWLFVGLFAGLCVMWKTKLCVLIN